ncbi:hypothetical protein [Nocardioides sp. 1609]|uniref:hypothetical protein n=1 Tax=Nocardioides sp. 1609 TaxID=2508327 RepID=UPI00106FDB3C|nr:hypothetical protein [Nocardioides sp. 1609]
MSSPEITVEDWADLERLPRAMDDVGQQLEDTLGYAVRWMCRRDGFATSPVCVLQPLAEVMDVVAAAFAGAGRRYLDDWHQLRDDVVMAGRELRASDDRATARAGVVDDAVAGAGTGEVG